jgi:hypothetical protein
MPDRDTIQEEYEYYENRCEYCGNKSRIKQLEQQLEAFVQREAARERIKGKSFVVSETPKQI